MVYVHTIYTSSDSVPDGLAQQLCDFDKKTFRPDQFLGLSYLEWFINDRVYVEIIKLDNVIVAYGILMPGMDDNSKLYVPSIGVLPEHQSKKLGTEIMRNMLNFNKTRDVILEVDAYDDRAIKFYKNLGFVEYGDTGSQICMIHLVVTQASENYISPGV
jgi:ribosomal protein S18 acetylase RimI-like enzyme